MDATTTSTHNPCCSSHGVHMDCDTYRRTHFVEVGSCCNAWAALHAYVPILVAGTTESDSNEHLAACTCGWVGIRYRDEGDAKRATDAHIAQPERLPGQDG